MASRSSDDLYFILQDAYEFGCREWDRLYPNLPKPFLTCSYRSVKEQNDTYAQGRTVKGKIVTRAKGGESPHNYKPSLAFDIAFVGQNKERTLDWRVELFRTFYGLIEEKYPEVEWGGSWAKFKDSPHFQMRNWKNYLAK